MGGNNEALVGTWKLVSCFMEDVETKEQKPAWGEHPNGYIVLTSEGRWIVVQTAEGRKAPQTDEERAAAFRSMLAYSGKYRTEGNKIVIKVDIAADEFGMALSKSVTFGLKVIGYTLKQRRSLTPILVAR